MRYPRYNRGSRKGEAGQTLVLAVTVMFLLVFLGGVFIALLRRNMSATERHSDALNAQQLAEAGISFVNDRLTNSVEGADWRPIPDSTPVLVAGNGALKPISVKPGCGDAVTRAALDPQDPDYKWLRPWAAADSGPAITIQDTRAYKVTNPDTGKRDSPELTLYPAGPTGGYTRMNYGGGRFLIRVTYNPVNDPRVGAVAPDFVKANQPSPLSRFIRIEAAGREGIVDREDPTTYAQQSLRRELIAFKPISLIDYVRFITDRQRSGENFTLGASKFPLLGVAEAAKSDTEAQQAGVPARFFGARTSHSLNAPGHAHSLNTFYGPVRSNAGLRIKGDAMIVLDEDPEVRPKSPGRLDLRPGLARHQPAARRQIPRRSGASGAEARLPDSTSVSSGSKRPTSAPSTPTRTFRATSC